MLKFRACATFAALVAVNVLLLNGANAQAQRASIIIHADQPGVVLSPEIQGQFVEHVSDGVYGGLWVGPNSPIPNTNGFRNDVIAALRHIRVPVVRWPGGCFADTYDWRDGIGPIENRPVRPNNNWAITEPNAVGTHEFMELADQLGTKTYVNINMGTGSAADMQEWLDYLTSPQGTQLSDQRAANGHAGPFPLDYIGLGNESWGCGGSMTPQAYDALVRQFSTFVRLPAGQTVRRVAVGPDSEDYNWTEVLMQSAGTARLFGRIALVDDISLHFYVFPGGSFANKGPSRGFDESLWFGAIQQTMRLDHMIGRHIEIMDRYDPEQRVGLAVDEWGTWHDSSTGKFEDLHQSNTLRDAMVAAAGLIIFQDHAERVRMANIAQMVNVLQAMAITDGETMVLTPTYHVFDMFKDFQGATYLPTEVDADGYVFDDQSVPSVISGAALLPDGSIKIAMVNFDPNSEREISLRIDGLSLQGEVTGQLLTGTEIDSANSPQHPDSVSIEPFASVEITAGHARLTLPTKSIVTLTIRQPG